MKAFLLSGVLVFGLLQANAAESERVATCNKLIQIINSGTSSRDFSKSQVALNKVQSGLYEIENLDLKASRDQGIWGSGNRDYPLEISCAAQSEGCYSKESDSEIRMLEKTSGMTTVVVVRTRALYNKKSKQLRIAHTSGVFIETLLSDITLQCE